MSAINFRSIATNTALRTILSKLAEIMVAERTNQREALGELSDRMRHLRGRNLLLGTSDEWFASADSTLKIPLADAPEAGETVTLSFDVELSAGTNNFLIYNSGWYGPAGAYATPVNGRVEFTWQWKVSTQGTNNVELWIQRKPDGATSACRYRRIKLERGGTSTEWCRADEDYDASPIAYFDHVETATMSRIIQPGWAPAGAQVVYDQAYKRFFAVSGGKWYGRWIGCEQTGTLYGSASATTTPGSGITPKAGKLYLCRQTGWPYVVIDDSIGLETLSVPI